jgi:hypothetical protein
MHFGRMRFASAAGMQYSESIPTLRFGEIMFGFLLWLLLLFLCWPLALIALVLYPIVWLILLPFRLLGVAVEGVFELLRAIVMLPARILGK